MDSALSGASYSALCTDQKDIREEPVVPPGYVNPCPPGITSPLTVWVMVAWIVVVALCVETFILWLRPAVFWLGRSARRGSLPPPVIATACTAVSVVVALWLTNQNRQICLATNTSAPTHITPAMAPQVTRAYDEFLMQAHIALGILAVAFVVRSVLTVVTFVTFVRGRRG